VGTVPCGGGGEPVSVFKPTRKTFKRNGRLARVRLVPNFHRCVRSECLEIAEYVCVESANAVTKIDGAVLGMNTHGKRSRLVLERFAVKFMCNSTDAVSKTTP